MIVYLIGVLCLVFIGAVRLVNYIRYDGFSLRALFVTVTVIAFLLGVAAFASRF